MVVRRYKIFNPKKQVCLGRMITNEGYSTFTFIFRPARAGLRKTKNLEKYTPRKHKKKMVKELESLIFNYLLDNGFLLQEVRKKSHKLKSLRRIIDGTGQN